MTLTPEQYQKALDDNRRNAFRRQSLCRNKPCPCKSGKKFKHCCMGKEMKKGER